MDLGLKDKVVMVAASSKGLGLGIAKEAAREGARVVLGSRNQKTLLEAARNIQTEIADARLYTYTLDVSDASSIEAWVKDALAELGTVDALVVNGGGPPAGTFDDIDDPAWLAGYENTLMSAVRLIRAVLPEMRRRQSGSILTITSSSVKEPIDMLLLSNVYRSGVTSLVKSLSIQEAKHGIRLNNLVPGFFNTDRLRALDERVSSSSGLSLEQVKDNNFKGIPMGRYGETGEFGRAAVFLLSEAASYVTGETFVIDGGKMRTVW